MAKKLAPGASSPELPFEVLGGGPLPKPASRPPTEKAHPLPLSARLQAMRSPTDLPALGDLSGRSLSFTSSAVAPPTRLAPLGREAPILRPGLSVTDLPALQALATEEAKTRPDPGPQGPRATGTTTVGVTTKDACVLATDHRATAGRLVSHMDTQKLFEIDRHLGMTIAGLVGDAQDLVRTLRAEARLFAMKHDRPIAVRAAAGTMANLLNQRKFAPYEVALLIGGVDRNGPRLYSLDEAGGSIPDKWATTGSGSPFVYGVLEDHYRDGLTTSEAVDLCIRGLNASTRRDSASGNGFDVATIDAKGFQWVPREETDRRLKKLGLPPIPK